MEKSKVTQRAVSADGKRLARHAHRALISSTALSLTLAIGVGAMVGQAQAQSGPITGPVTVSSGETLNLTADTPVTYEGGGAQSAITVQNGGTLTGTDAIISSDGTYTSSGQLGTGIRANGTVNLTGGSINATGAQFARGILAYGSNASVTTNGTNISTTGSNSHAVHAHTGPNININGGLISTLGSDSFGLSSQNSGSILNASDVTITTAGENGFGAYAYNGGELDLKRGMIETSGLRGHGVVATESSSIAVNGTRIHTKGQSAWGLVADKPGATIDAVDVEIVTDGTRGYGAHTAADGEIEITGGTINTSGTRGYGLYAIDDSSISVEDVTIITEADEAVDWAFGAFAQDDATISLDGGSVTTNGTRSFGLLASGNGTIDSNANVTTNGNFAHGVQTGESASSGGGTINLTGGTITTNGIDAYGLHALSGGIIKANGAVTIKTTGLKGYAVFAESESSIELTGTTVRTIGGLGHGLLANNDKGSTGGTITAVDVDVLVTGASADAVRVEKGGAVTISGGSHLEATNGAGIGLVDNATVTVSDTDIVSSGATISSTIEQAGQRQTININAGTVATDNSGVLLNVTRTGDGADGEVFLNLRAGSTTSGDIIDSGATGEGGTDVMLEEGASWTGLLQGVRNFFGRQDGEVVFEGEADISGDLRGDGTDFVFSDQGGSIDGDVVLNDGSSTTGGTIEDRIEVAGNVAVNGLSTLGGNWDIAGNLTSTGGILSPGNSIGEVNVDGNVTLDPASTYVVDVNGARQSDLVTVGGNAAVAGTIEIGTMEGVELGYNYVILEATGELTGEFTSITKTPLFLDAAVSNDHTDTVDRVLLTFERNGMEFASVAESANQTAVANALDVEELFSDTNSIANSILVANADNVNAAFNQLTGEVHASVLTGLVEDSQAVRNAASDRVRAAFGAVAAPALPVMSFNGDKAPTFAAAEPAGNDVAVWGTIFGSRASTDATGNTAEFDRSTGGILVGVDGLVGDAWRVGALAGYSRSSYDADALASSADADHIHLGLYGGTQWGAVGFRTGLAYTWSDIDTSRVVTFLPDAETLEGSYDAGTFQIFGELGYKVDAGQAAFEPFVNLAHVRARTDAFTETGGAAALSTDRSTTNTTFTTVGVRASTEFVAGESLASLHGMIGWRHAGGDIDPTTANTFDGSDVFTITGAPIARNAAVIEAGVNFGLSHAANLDISYNGQFGSDAEQHGLKSRLSVKF